MCAPCRRGVSWEGRTQEVTRRVYDGVGVALVTLFQLAARSALKAGAELDELFTDGPAEIGIRGFAVLVEHARGLGLLANLLVSLAL